MTSGDVCLQAAVHGARSSSPPPSLTRVETVSRCDGVRCCDLSDLAPVSQITASTQAPCVPTRLTCLLLHLLMGTDVADIGMGRSHRHWQEVPTEHVQGTGISSEDVVFRPHGIRWIKHSLLEILYQRALIKLSDISDPSLCVRVRVRL